MFTSGFLFCFVKSCSGIYWRCHCPSSLSEDSSLPPTAPETPAETQAQTHWPAPAPPLVGKEEALKAPPNFSLSSSFPASHMSGQQPRAVPYFRDTWMEKSRSFVHFPICLLSLETQLYLRAAFWVQSFWCSEALQAISKYPLCAHVCVSVCVCLQLISCGQLWDPVDYSPAGSSVHGILQARKQEQVAKTTHAAAKSRQSCPTLCDPIDGSPPGSCPWDSPGKNTRVGPVTNCKFTHFEKYLTGHVWPEAWGTWPEATVTSGQRARAVAQKREHAVCQRQGRPPCEGRDSPEVFGGCCSTGPRSRFPHLQDGPPRWLLSEASSGCNPPLLRRLWDIPCLKLSF